MSSSSSSPAVAAAASSSSSTSSTGATGTSTAGSSTLTLDPFDLAVEKLLKESMCGKTIAKPVIKAFSEYVKLFAKECVGRAYQEAMQDPSSMNEDGTYTVDLQHIEKVIPQLLLDFC